MITKEKIYLGLKDNLVSFCIDPNIGAGTVCKIGDYWFYFGGATAEEMDPDEYLNNVPMADIVDEVFDALEEFREDPYLIAEYDYYDGVLSNPKLLPCPFCGGRAFFTYDANATHFIYARCSCCQSRTSGAYFATEDGKEQAYKEAAQKWNRRAPI